MMREKGIPPPGERPSAHPGTRMLDIPSCLGDPMKLAEESVEQLRREHPPRPMKTNKKKPKRRGAIGAPRAQNRKVLSGDEN